MITSMFGLMSLISSSMHRRVPVFPHLIVERVENASSHKYEEENCNEMASAFLDIDTCSSSIEIQRASRDNSLYLIINPRSVVTADSSSFSVSVKLEYVAFSTRGFLIQSYKSVLIN